MIRNMYVIFILPMACLQLLCSDFFVNEGSNPAQPDAVTLSHDVQLFSLAARITWSMTASRHFSSYRIYYDTVPGVSEKSILAAANILKSDTSCMIAGLVEKATYYARVYVRDGNANSVSNEISFVTNVCSCGNFTGERKDGMVLVPAGCFYCKDGSRAAISSDFYIDSTEVTVAQWNRTMDSSRIGEVVQETLPETWRQVLEVDTLKTRNPKTSISWYLMLLYCNERSKKMSRDTCYTYTQIVLDTAKHKIAKIDNIACDFSADGFRLPTEDEWEYAYHAGIEQEYYWGKDGNTQLEYPFAFTYPADVHDSLEISEYCWWSFNNDPDGHKVVAQKKPNAWGLYDMAGNVEEAIWNLYSVDPRPDNRVDYTGVPMSQQSYEWVYTRGGAFNAISPFLLSGWYSISNLDFAGDYCYNDDAVGFRVVRKK